MDKTSPYQYAPLDLHEEIRLLVLDASGVRETVFGKAIECSLVHVRLANKPAYRALSYRWGETTDVRQLLVNGQTMWVRENLWFALWYILAHDRARASQTWKSTTRCLWVDAVCINQNDIGERNHQVGIMSQIYSKAEEVAVWLGRGEELTDLAIETLQGLGKPEEWVSLQQDTQGRWRALKGLFELEYFSRMWIVQEVVLARCLTIYCGSKSVDWSKLNYLREHLRSVNLASRNELSNWTFIEGMNKNLAMELDRNRKAWEGRNTHLVQLLEACQFCNCSDPRDKVYSLLGFASDCQNNELLADYSKTLFLVYNDVISFWSSQKEINPAVPQYTVRLSQMLQKSFADSVEMEKGAMGAKVTTDLSSAILFPVIGIWCGIISRLGPSFRVLDHPATPRSPCSEQGETLDLWEYLLREHVGGVAAVTSSSSFANVYYRERLSLRASLGHVRRSLSRPKNLLGVHKLERNDTSVPLPEEKKFCFFETANGFIGIGPEHIAPDDLICQFTDCNVAVVLRRANLCTSGRWIIIGSVVIFNKSGGGDDAPSEHAAFQIWAHEAKNRDVNTPFSSPSHAELPSYYSEGVGGDEDSRDMNNEPEIRLHLDIFTLQKLTRFYVYNTNTSFV